MSKPRGPKQTPSRPVPSAWQAALAGSASDPLKRAEWLASQGYRVVRYWTVDVMKNIDGVLAHLMQELGKN